MIETPFHPANRPRRSPGKGAGCILLPAAQRNQAVVE
jgi:hypothetical protein